MATPAEIEAAVEAIVAAEAVAAQKLSIRTYAMLALDAAERVRPRRDPTAVERLRAHRARKRAMRNVAGNVAGNAPAAGNVSHETLHPEGNVSAPIDKIAPEPAPILSMLPDTATAELLARLTDAADGNVAGAVDVAPIQTLLAAGCDLDLDVLPVVRDIATGPTPIKRWDHPGLIRAILRGREIRIAPKAPPVPIAATVTVRQPSPGGFDMDELVAGYRAGNVDWDVTRLGPPPGSPGCRVDAGILRANGYR
jgi:hypothetical protein